MVFVFLLLISLRDVLSSPFKKYESEVMAQYFRLYKKVRTGVDFIITQLGFDARKFKIIPRLATGLWIRPLPGPTISLAAITTARNDQAGEKNGFVL